MNNLSNKQMRNTRTVNPYRYDSTGEEETRWGLRHAGSWPSDWAPRRACKLCKKEFRTDTDDGFSDWYVDVCASCIHKLVKKELAKTKCVDVEFTPRIDEIRVQ